MTTLPLSPRLRELIVACRRAEARYLPGRMSASVVEIPQIELARAVLAAVAEHGTEDLLTQLVSLPKPKPAQVPVVEIQMRRKRRTPA